MTHESKWLDWAREIQALGQSGLAYSQSEFDQQRYRRLLELAAEIVSACGHVPPDELRISFIAQQGYATPKIDLRGAILRDGKILLVQERADGRWSMPGGWADVGESPSDAVVREILEESGFEARVRKVIGVYDANRGGRPMEFYHAYKIVFLCDILGGEARPSSETLAVDFFDFAHLPPLSGNRTNRIHLAEIRAHLSDPGRTTAFD